MDVPTAIWASQLLGGTVTGMNPAYTYEEVQHQLTETDAICLFTCKALLPVVERACENRPIKIILLDGQVPGYTAVQDVLALGETSSQLPKWNLSPGENKTRLAFLSFSSGTTGKPKGVMISHHNVIANTLQNGQFFELKKGEGAVALGLLPFYHIYGLVVILHTEIYLGNTIVLMPGFDLENFLNVTEKYQISKMFLVPPLVVRLTKDPSVAKRGRPLKTVTECFCGAAPLATQLMDELRAIMSPGAIFRQGYGMTETCTTSTITHTSDQWDGSIGCTIPDVVLKLMSQDGQEVTEYDRPGELWVKGPNVTLGYYKNKKATDECYIRDESDGQTWLVTGDEAVVRKSPGGKEHFFIVDRLKELIKVKGLQVAPAELEAALLDHKAIADAAVIGVADERAGELPYAFVVLHQGVARSKETKESILKSIEATKAKFKWIKGGLEFMDVIPKSASGKILRKDLRLMMKSRAKL